MIKLGGIVELQALATPGRVVSNPYARAFTPIKEEETIEEQDHEVSMAQSSLDSIIKYANDLKQQLGNMEKEIPAWIQDHISKSENYIQQAANFYHEYEGVEGIKVSNNEVNEAMSNKAPKMYIKYAAVVKKIRELEDKQKELAQPYFDARSKGDSVKEKSQLELMKKNQAELNSYRKNLKNIEDKYINAMDYFPGE
jgi:hypothetical protein